MLTTKANPIILMNGPPRTGKNFVEDLLAPHFNVVQLALADAVKLTTLFAHGVVSEADPLQVNEALARMEADKSRKRNAFGGRSWRETLIRTAESHRLLYGDVFWANTAVRKVRDFDKYYDALRENSRPVLILVTDIGFPGDLGAFEFNFPDRSILLRTHREDKTFGKLPGYEEAYGAGTGTDSRNYVFAKNIPSADWVNDGNEAEARHDLITLLGRLIGWDVLKRVTLDRNDKTLLQLRMAKSFKVAQSIIVLPFKEPKMYWPDLTTFIGQDPANFNVVNSQQAS